MEKEPCPFISEMEKKYEVARIHRKGMLELKSGFCKLYSRNQNLMSLQGIG